jgi:hypothetical protein
MAYELSYDDDPSTATDLRHDYFLGFYDLIGDDLYSHDWEWAIHQRSALEFIRDRLTDVQRAQLDEIDAFWRARPAVFNKAFGVFHHRPSARTLKGFVQDEDGKVPEIPADHWWWNPLEVA